MAFGDKGSRSPFLDSGLEYLWYELEGRTFGKVVERLGLDDGNSYKIRATFLKLAKPRDFALPPSHDLAVARTRGSLSKNGQSDHHSLLPAQTGMLPP